MKVASRILATIGMWLALAATAMASDDFFTTDFQFDLQPKPGLFFVYDGTLGLAPSGTTGYSLLHRLGADLCPTRGVDVFVTGHFLDFNFKRTNRYTFGVDGRTIGLRLHALPESRNPVGVTVGVLQEENDLGQVFKNGVNLGITSPAESSLYGFLLVGKQVHPRWRLQGGVQGGNASVGPVSSTAWNWNVGAEYWLDNKQRLSLAANLKDIHLQGEQSNQDISLRLNYRPTESFGFQLRGDYFTHGFTGQIPVIEPLASTLGRRYQQSPSLSVSLQVTARFGWAKGDATSEPAKPAPADSAPAKPGPAEPVEPTTPAP